MNLVVPVRPYCGRLHKTRIRLIAIETFKILHKLTPAYLHDQVTYKESRYSFRYDNLADLPRVRTTRHGKSTFRYEAATVWNSLPNELRKSRTLVSSGGLSTRGVAPLANVLCVSLVNSMFCLVSLFSHLCFLLLVSLHLL